MLTWTDLGIVEGAGLANIAKLLLMLQDEKTTDSLEPRALPWSSSLKWIELSTSRVE